MIVGKDVSANGYVMLAHTEDFAPPRLITVRREPRLQADTSAATGRGVTSQEWSRLLTEVEVEEFSDCIMNEWGVVIASNQCPSRLDDRVAMVDGIVRLNTYRVYDAGALYGSLITACRRLLTGGR